MDNPIQEPNVTKEGATIRVKRSRVKAVTADLVKREIKSVKQMDGDDENS